MSVSEQLLSFAALPCETVENVDEFVQPMRLLRLTLGDAVGDASFDVKLEDREADPIERGFGSRELLKDLHAQPGLLDHPADAAHLPLDAVQPRDNRLLLLLVQHYSPSLGVKGTIQQ